MLNVHGFIVEGGIKVIGRKEADTTREVLDMIYDNLEFRQDNTEFQSDKYWDLQNKKTLIKELIDSGILGY